MSTTYWTFRLTLLDHINGPAEVADTLAGLGATLLDGHLHPSGQDRAADDLVIALPYWCEPATVEGALRAVGIHEVAARRLLSGASRVAARSG